MPNLLQGLTEVVERIGNHSCIGYAAHEIGIALPARYNVEVIVRGDSRAGGRPDIGANVKSRWIGELPKRPHRPVRQGDQVAQRLHVQVFLGRDMGIGNNHDMPIAVWILVQGYVSMAGAENNKIVPVAFRARGHRAENAIAVEFAIAFDVIHAPGRPEVIQSSPNLLGIDSFGGSNGAISGAKQV